MLKETCFQDISVSVTRRKEDFLLIVYKLFQTIRYAFAIIKRGPMTEQQKAA